jgi:hypothetical protein
MWRPVWVCTKIRFIRSHIPCALVRRRRRRQAFFRAVYTRNIPTDTPHPVPIPEVDNPILHLNNATGTKQQKPEFPQVGEIMEFIRFRRRLLGRCVEINLREDRVLLEVPNETTPVAVNPKSISLRLGFCTDKDQKPPSVESIVTQARDLLAQIRHLAIEVWTSLRHQDSFTLNEACAVIQQWWSLRAQPNPPEYVWRYATHLLLTETWLKFGLRHHGLYYAYPAEYCMQLERQWHAINDLVAVHRLVTLLRPLTAGLLEISELRDERDESQNGEFGVNMLSATTATATTMTTKTTAALDDVSLSTAGSSETMQGAAAIVSHTATLTSTTSAGATRGQQTSGPRRSPRASRPPRFNVLRNTEQSVSSKNGSTSPSSLSSSSSSTTTAFTEPATISQPPAASSSPSLESEKNTSIDPDEARRILHSDPTLQPLIDALIRYALAFELWEVPNVFVYLRILKPLGLQGSPTNVQMLLVRAGVWTENTVPYVEKLAHSHLRWGPLLQDWTPNSTPPPAPVPTPFPSSTLPSISEDVRRVTFEVPAYAIDEAATTEVDDAISLEQRGEQLWVHVHISSPVNYCPSSTTYSSSLTGLIAHTADDLQARRRASTIYLPTQRFPLLPRAYSESFSLNPTKMCRALTFSARVDNTSGELTDFTITPSFVRVLRLTYQHVEECLRTSLPPATSQLSERDVQVLHQLYTLAVRRRQYRSELGAQFFSLPRPKVLVDAHTGRVSLNMIYTPLAQLLVEEMMILTNELAARHAHAESLPIPLRVQRPPQIPEEVRNELKNITNPLVRQLRLLPYQLTANTMGPTTLGHYSLGLDTYGRVTSPLRRYADVLYQYQFAAWITGRPLPFTETELRAVLHHVDATDRYIHQLQDRCERFFTLRYVQQQGERLYEGIVYQLGPTVDQILAAYATPPTTMSTVSAATTTNSSFHNKDCEAAVYLPSLGLHVRCVVPSHRVQIGDCLQLRALFTPTTHPLNIRFVYDHTLSPDDIKNTSSTFSAFFASS